MTPAEQSLADDKMRAEIARLIAETAKLIAETAKINRESQWYPAIVASCATLAIVVVVKLYLT